jgi:hypothetical protein
MCMKQRLANLNRIEQMLIDAVRYSSMSTNIVYSGKGWDSIAISAVNTNNVDTLPSVSEGHYQ